MKQLAGSMKQFISVYMQSVRMVLMIAMENKISFVFLLVSLLVRIATTLFFFEAIYLQVDEIAGWNFTQLLVLLGTFFLLDAIGRITYMNGFQQMPNMVETGLLDVYMIKPISLRAYLSARFPSVTVPLIKFFIAVAIIVYALIALGTSAHVVGYLYVLILAIVLHYSLVSLMSTINFFSVIPQMGWLVGTVFELGKYPMAIYTGAVSFVLSFILPIGFMFSFPARVVTGVVSGYEFLLATVVTVFFYMISTVIWNYGEKQYASAQG